MFYEPSELAVGVQKYYTEGGCNLLAHELSKRTGYPVIGFNDTLHYGVQLPNNLILDIEGLRDTENFLERWGRFFNKNTRLMLNPDMETVSRRPVPYDTPALAQQLTEKFKDYL